MSTRAQRLRDLSNELAEMAEDFEDVVNSAEEENVPPIGATFYLGSEIDGYPRMILTTWTEGKVYYTHPDQPYFLYNLDSLTSPCHYEYEGKPVTGWPTP